MKKPTILKFGGTSMGSEGTWRQVMQIIAQYEHPVVVVSATARTTRRLLAAAETARTDLDEALAIKDEIEDRHRKLISNLFDQLFGGGTNNIASECQTWISERMEELVRHLDAISSNGKLELKTKDAVASLGEQLSSYLFARAATIKELNTAWVDARSIIKTDSSYGRANPDMEKINRQCWEINSLLEKGYVPVIGGYYGENAEKEITTLGFEGSDFSASIIGSALDAKSIEIWTDVSGIYTCDPRIVPDARSIEEMTFREATELAYFGAKVLHPATMKPASFKNIPIQVKNIFEPGRPGTRIHQNARESGLIRAMTYLEDIEIITVTSSETLMGYRFLSNVFSILDVMRIPVDVVTTTEASVSVAMETHHPLSEIKGKLEEIGEVSTLGKQGLISLIGCSFDDLESITHNVFSVLQKTEISMISYSHTKRNLNLVLQKHNLIPAVKTIHAQLFS